MKNYTLTKTVKGKKFLYQVFDNENNLISKRESTRDYVACTAGGSLYFGRLDLIGKGDHGRLLNQSISDMNASFDQYAKRYKAWGHNVSVDHYEEIKAYSKKRFDILNSIAYL